MIRLAEKRDINQIMEITEVVIKEMKRDENHQWDQSYPQKENFLKDINQNNLFVFVFEKDRESILGFICIDFNEPAEYKQLNWSSKEKALVIHRMAVSSKERGQGVATKLMAYAEELGKVRNVDYIHTDTYSTNKAMNDLLVKLDYKFIGEVNMMDKPFVFNCYERKIN